MRKTLLVSSLTILFNAFFLWAGSDTSSGDILKLHVKDVSRLVELGEDSPYMRFWKSESMKALRSKIEENYKKSMAEFQKEVSLNEKPDFTKLVKGELILALTDIEVDLKKEKLGSFATYLTFDGGKGKNDLAEQLFKTVLKSMDEEAKKGHPRKDVRYMDVLFHTSKQKAKGKNAKKMPEDTQLMIGKINQYYFMGLGQDKKLKKVLAQLIPSIRASKKANFKEDVRFMFNMEPVNKIMEQALEKAEEDKAKKLAAGKQGKNPMAMMMAGVDIVKVVKALGLLDLKNMKFRSRMSKGSGRHLAELNFNHDSRGIWNLFLPGENEGVEGIPSWVPSDVQMVAVSAFPISGWYDTIIDFINTELPMLSPMVMGQMNQFKQMLSLDLKKDIFSLFTDRIIQLQFKAEQKSALSQRDVYMLGVRDSKKLEAGLLKLAGMAPMLALKPEEYMGGRTYQLPGKPGNKPGLAFAENFLIFATRFEDVKKVMRLTSGKPMSALVKSRELENHLKKLPKVVQSISYMDMNKMVKSILGLTKSAFSRKNGVGAEGQELIDLLPGPEMVKEDFGHVFGYSVRSKRSIRSVILSQEK